MNVVAAVLVVYGVITTIAAVVAMALCKAAAGGDRYLSDPQPPAARAAIQERNAVVLLFPRTGAVENVIPMRRPDRQAPGEDVVA